MQRCSEKAFAKCPTRHLCGTREDATFADNSECAAFNRAVEDAPMTNADRIRAMSDRELASFLAKYAVSGSNLRLIDLGYQPTATELEVLHEQLATTWMRWLRQPAENNETVTDCHR